MLTRLQALGAKIQAAAGVAETIAAGDVVLVSNLSFQSDTPVLETENYTATLSTEPGISGRSFATMTFDMLFYGGTGAGVVPDWGKLIRACGRSETIVASTSVTYAMASSSIPILTMKAFIDGVSREITDCKGGVSISRPAGELVKLSFSFQGLWDPADSADAIKDEAILVATTTPPSPLKYQNSGLTIGGSYLAGLHSLDTDDGNSLNMVPNGNTANYSRADITSRDPGGTIVIDKITQAVYDVVIRAKKKEAVQIKGYCNSIARGSGTGSATTMTDTTKKWPTNEFSGKELLDSAGTTFPIASNTATALTVASGTPASGNYIIYTAGNLIEETIPKAELQGVTPGDVNGTATQSIAFKQRKNAAAGNDEHEIVLR